MCIGGNMLVYTSLTNKQNQQGAAVRGDYRRLQRGIGNWHNGKTGRKGLFLTLTNALGAYCMTHMSQAKTKKWKGDAGCVI